MMEQNRRLGGIKQEIQVFKAKFNSLLVGLKNKIQTKFGIITSPMKLKTLSKVILMSKLMKA